MKELHSVVPEIFQQLVVAGNEQAVRSGKWKGLVKRDQFFLYDLSNDIAEQNDLASKHPDIAKRLKQYLKLAYLQPRSQQDDGKYTGRPPKAKETRRKRKSKQS